MRFCLLVFILSTMVLLNCASANKQTRCSNILEKFNRSMYNFNYNVLDHYIVRPAAVAWCDYVPYSVRNRLSNFTNNLEEPATTVNYFLQGNPYRGMAHFTRFFLNTILGVGGFFDVASITNHPELQREQPHCFGSTLGYYGVGYGPYVHLPFYGSFTIRDDGGNIVDMFYPVLSWLTWPLSIGKWIIEKIEMRAQMLNTDYLLYQASDPYIVVCETYFQNHDFIANSSKLDLKDTQNIKIIEDKLLEIDAE